MTGVRRLLNDYFRSYFRSNSAAVRSGRHTGNVPGLSDTLHIVLVDARLMRVAGRSFTYY